MRHVRRILLAALLLALMAHAIWDRVESRRLAADIARIAARGEPTVVDEAVGVLTGEPRDAARIYAAAVERLQDETRDEAFRYRQLDIDNPAGAPGTLEDLESRYRKDAPSLQLLDQATPLDFAGFGDVAPELHARPDALVGLSALNALRADLSSMRGRGDQAAEVLVASVRLQRTIPSSFNRSIASRRVLGSLRILLRHASPGAPSLVKLQSAFEALPDSDTLTRELIESRVQFLEALALPPQALGEAVAGRLLRPWFTSEARRQLRLFDEAMSFVRGPWSERFDRAADFERRIVAEMKASQRRARLHAWIRPRRGAVFVGTALSPAAYDLAVRRIAIATLAVERYRRANGGALPPTLEVLVPDLLAAVPQDPFSGQPLIYKNAAGDYRIYSVDNNRKDDGGEVYGVGSRGQLMPRSGAPHDFGILVPLSRGPSVAAQPIR